jgi:hypothetical protein
VENNKLTGLSSTVFTTREEILNAKQGGSTLVAFDKPDNKTGRTYQLSVTVDACDFLEGGEVRVNLDKVSMTMTKMGEVVGASMGAELERVFAPIMELMKS